MAVGAASSVTRGVVGCVGEQVGPFGFRELTAGGAAGVVEPRLYFSGTADLAAGTFIEYISGTLCKVEINDLGRSAR